MNIIKLLFFITVFCSATCQQNNPLTILIMHFATDYWGGTEVHALNCHKTLARHGHHVTTYTAANSRMQTELTKLNLSYKTFDKKELSDDISDTCAALKTDIVLCNAPFSFDATCVAAQHYPVHVIFVQHMPMRGLSLSFMQRLKNSDGVIAVSPMITQELEMRNKENNLDIKKIVYIPPFLDEEKSALFFPTQTKQDFFKTHFNIKIQDYPIVCMIANMYDDLKLKSHPLFFKAIAKLVHKKNRPLHVMLAGDGIKRAYLEEMVKKMNLQDYVHFLGLTEQTPALLHYSDMHVLSSNHEAFGLVHVEAGLMGTPTIGATKTGAEAIIQDGITGFLFENNNPDDLANKIEQLIDNPDLRARMSIQAHAFVQEHFSNHTHYLKLKNLFDEIIKN